MVGTFMLESAEQGSCRRVPQVRLWLDENHPHDNVHGLNRVSDGRGPETAELQLRSLSDG